MLIHRTAVSQRRRPVDGSVGSNSQRKVPVSDVISRITELLALAETSTEAANKLARIDAILNELIVTDQEILNMTEEEFIHFIVAAPGAQVWKQEEAFVRSSKIIRTVRVGNHHYYVYRTPVGFRCCNINRDDYSFMG